MGLLLGEKDRGDRIVVFYSGGTHMITAIKERSAIKGGRITLPPLDYPDGTEVEVIVLVEEVEMDATDYLMSTKANREHLRRVIQEAEDFPERRLIYKDLDELKKDFPTT